MRALPAIGLTIIVTFASACAHRPPPVAHAPLDTPVVTQPPRVVPHITQAELDEQLRLVAVTPNESADEPALMHRLAELYLQQADFFATHPDRVAAAHERSQWQLAGAKTLNDLTLLPGFSTYARADEVLFRFTRELLVLKKDATARKYCMRLLKEHPDSVYIPDAFFAFGDYYFEQHDLKTAAQFYNKVLEFGDSGVSEAARRQLQACARQP